MLWRPLEAVEANKGRGGSGGLLRALEAVEAIKGRGGSGGHWRPLEAVKAIGGQAVQWRPGRAEKQSCKYN
eukprot:358715-Chlamydomonas_euryale.AAC.3